MLLGKSRGVRIAAPLPGRGRVLPSTEANRPHSLEDAIDLLAASSASDAFARRTMTAKFLTRRIDGGKGWVPCASAPAVAMLPNSK